MMKAWSFILDKYAKNRSKMQKKHFFLLKIWIFAKKYVTLRAVVIW